MFLGEDLLPLLILAFGAALFVGNALALVRPPDPSVRPSTSRIVAMALMGLVAAIWGAASALTN